MSEVIDRILNRIQESDEGSAVTTKTAAEQPPSQPSHDTLLEKVRSVSQGTKTASSESTTGDSTPSDQLATLAKEAQVAEEERLNKEAHYLGAALADGFMERFAAYDTALQDAGVKTAGDNDGDIQKGDIQKVANAAYAQAIQDMEKKASEEYERGYHDQLAAIHKVASEIHYAGQATANSILTNNSNQ